MTMTRRERLMNTLNGKTVDRPPVCFYEINGMDENPADPDPFNIYSHPSWKPLLDLARDHSDRILMRGARFGDRPADPLAERTEHQREIRDGSALTVTRVQADDRVLTTRTRRDPDINTVWTEEHLLKDEDDLAAYLALPEPVFGGTPDVAPVIAAEEKLGDSGIVMLDTPDPLCCAASLFDMGTYTVMALTEQQLFGQLLDRFAAVILPQVEAMAEALPGHLWRIYGPEYASEPYLPPRLFEEYVVRYAQPMVEAIQRHGGFARIHCHGNLKAILDAIAGMGTDALDPIEPPPQGDIRLADVRRDYGREMVLFGNLEISDIENLPPTLFRDKVATALREGTAEPGRGFVLMPSACPYGRELKENSLRNYELMVQMAVDQGRAGR